MEKKLRIAFFYSKLKNKKVGIKKMKKIQKQFGGHELSLEAFEVYINSTYVFTEQLECYSLNFDKSNYVTKFDSIEELEQFLLQQS